MEVEVTFLTRRGAAVMRRAQHVSAPRIGLGRGTDNAVPLADIRVGLHIAALVPRIGGMAIERVGTSPLVLNGADVASAPLTVGDELLLGPYRIEVLQTPEGCDGAIQIELVQPMGAALERLTSGSRIGLDRTSASKRRYAWTGFIVIAVLCLAVPLVVFGNGWIAHWRNGNTSGNHHGATLVGLSWNTGEFSNAHRFFAADCATCHQGGFTRVADSACLACHGSVGGHVEHGVQLGAVGDKLASTSCIDCHSEHRGIEGNVIRTGALCLGCHENLAETASAAGLPDVGGFPKGHPQFRATLVADAGQGTTVRAQIGANPPPADHPGIKFSHAAHLLKGGFPVLGYKELNCADCHVADPSGETFLPITYKNQCQHCHELTFDSVALPWPDAKVPHGDATGVIAAVWNYYAALALRGGTTVPAPSAAPGPGVERRGAGTTPPPAAAPPPPATAPAADTTAWVTARSAAALRLIFDERRGCAYCHEGTGPNGAFDTDKILAAALPPKANPPPVVAAVSLRTRFLPNAVFDHSAHRGMQCEECHAARQAQTSSQVLIPGIQTCVKCHGNENAALRAQSTCIDCHDFHRNEFGPMRMTAETMQ